MRAAVLVLALAVLTQPESATVAEAGGFRFVSDPLLNLHHVLYGAAWARRPDHGHSLSDDLPGTLTAPMTGADERTWNAALDFYDRHLIAHDLLRDARMVELQAALVSGDFESPALPAGLAHVLETAMPIYQRYFWSAHDRVNRAWIEATAPRVQEVADVVVPRLEKLYDAKWMAPAIRTDVVWVANREGAYTTLADPPHITTEPAEKEWTAVEIVFHEGSHVLAAPMQDRLVRALGDRARANGALPHAVLFYVTGAVVQEALKDRGITYTPASVAMFSRVWPQYRTIVESSWEPYVHGKRTLDEAIAATAAALP